VFLYRCDSNADYRSAMKRDISLTISRYLSLSQRSAAIVETGLYNELRLPTRLRRGQSVRASVITSLNVGVTVAPMK